MGDRSIQLPRRKSLRLPDWDYAEPGGYFLTICTHQKVFLFGEVVGQDIRLNRFGQCAEYEWRKTGIVRPNVVVDEFIVMPNHVHGILILTDTGRGDPFITNGEIPSRSWVARSGPKPGSIGAIIGQYKSQVTKIINGLRGGPGCLVWQRGYYERVIRTSGELDRIREYILNNPYNWAEDPLRG